MVVRELVLVWALLLVAATAAPAAEIDSVTRRGEQLGDSRRALNAGINAMLREGVALANERGEGCDERELYRSLRKRIASPFVGHRIAERLNQDEQLDSRRVRFEDSVYRDLGIFDAISVHLKDLSAVVRVGDQLVGVDKLGHFLVQGWKYFEIAVLEGNGIAAAMRWGERAERSYYGLLTTGVYSYADLAVNFDGMRFWLRVLGPRKDPLRRGFLFNRSWVKCARRLWSREPYWKLRRKLDLADFVNAGWDEGMNCSRYRDERIAAHVAQRVRELERIDGARYTCPIDPRSCAAARERYGPHAPALLHPLCLEAQAPRRSFFDLFRWGR